MLFSSMPFICLENDIGAMSLRYVLSVAQYRSTVGHFYIAVLNNRI